MDIKKKLEILTDAAKYDVSCSSSGSSRKNKNGLGNASTSGICHSWSQDGRCISLLKILLTNKCIYSCEYCINSNKFSKPRAEFTPKEISDLVINFYKRNYIEGLFLSSGVLKSPDYTMSKLIETAQLLREKENFNGYIHMKAIPGSSPELIQKLGSLVDRMSVNIELPTQKSLALLAPEKTYDSIFKPMGVLKESLLQTKEDRKKYKSSPKFLPAGQSTQMIVGATGEDDLTIIKRAESLYQDFQLKRVYYSGFVPATKSKLTEHISAVPLLREHRIYQADWLMRFYGFNSKDILKSDRPFFDLSLDPKANWAIENIDLFPIEINHANYQTLLKIPGFGPGYARKFSNLTYDDLKALKISTKRAKHFITVNGVFRGSTDSSKENLRQTFLSYDKHSTQQLSFLE